MRKASLKFLEELCNAPGPTGFEREPTLLTRKYIEKHSDAIEFDKLGSMLFTKKGSAKNPVIFLPGHADEIGFVISGIHSTGFMTFNPLGGWPDQVLMGQRVEIMTRKNGLIPGVIAAKPIHLMSAEERKQLVTKDKMFIDIGCSNPDEVAEMGVRIGDAVVPVSRFSVIEKTAYRDGKKNGKRQIGMGRAFDNRAGLFVASEVIRRLAEEKIKHPNTVVGAATTQEEVGLRGATTAGYMIQPDVCMSLDVDVAGDCPGIDKHQANSSLGSGVSICTYDKSMIPNQKLKELVIDTAEEERIPYTLTSTSGGGQDGGAVHKVREGCPTIYLGIPTRHIHSHVGMADLEDMQRMIDLVLALVKKMDAKTVASLTEIK